MRDFVEFDKEERGLPPVRSERWVDGISSTSIPAQDHFRLAVPLATPARGGGGPVAGDRRQAGRDPLQLEDHGRRVLGGVPRPHHPPLTVGPTLATRGTVITLYTTATRAMVSPVNRGTGATAGNCCRYSKGPTAVFRRPRSTGPRHLPEPHLPARRAVASRSLVFWPVAIDRTRLDIIWFAADWGEGEMPLGTGPTSVMPRWPGSTR